MSIDEVYFSHRMILEHIGWTDRQIRSYTKQLEDPEYICDRIGAWGREHAHVLDYYGQSEENGKYYLNLTTVEEIKKLIGHRLTPIITINDFKKIHTKYYPSEKMDPPA